MRTRRAWRHPCWLRRKKQSREALLEMLGEALRNGSQAGYLIQDKGVELLRRSV